MDELLKKYVSLCETEQIEIGGPIPKILSFRELEYLYGRGFIIEDGNRFVAAVTDGFGQ